MTLVHNSGSKCCAIINISLGISCGVLWAKWDITLRAKWDHDVPFDRGIFVPSHFARPYVMSKTYKIGTTVQNDCTVFIYNVVLHDKKHSDEIIMRRNIC